MINIRNKKKKIKLGEFRKRLQIGQENISKSKQFYYTSTYYESNARQMLFSNKIPFKKLIENK